MKSLSFLTARMSAAVSHHAASDCLSHQDESDETRKGALLLE